MPANLIIPLSKEDYEALVNNPDGCVAAAKTDALFVFDPAHYSVEIHGEFRELGQSSNRRSFRDLLSNDLRDPEKAIASFGTLAYQILTENRRDQARAALANSAPPGGVAIGPPAGVTPQMDASQAGQQMLGNGGFVLGYDHKDQGSKDFTTDLIKKSGGAGLKHLFVEELSSDLQAEIDAFLADPAAEMPANLLTRIKELQDSSFNADFEPMLYAAREKGVKIWGIDSSKADPQVTTDDPRYHERRLALMNAEAKRVFDHVRATYPNEPFMALTGQMHVNTADGGVPGLAQIMGVPGVSFDADSNRLAFVPEDTSKRAAVSPLERDCVEEVLKKAGTDYKQFFDNFKNTPAYKTLPDPKPNLNSKLNLPQVTSAVQRVVAQFTAGGQLGQARDIPRLLKDPAVAAALKPIFQATILRSSRREQLATAIKAGDLPSVKGALDADPFLCKMPLDDGKKDTLLHGACEAGQPAIVRELLSRGLDPNATDLKGQAPIHRLLGERSGTPPAAKDLADVVGQILASGGNSALADPSGNTGLELAKTGPLASGEVLEKFVATGAAPATDLFGSKFVEETKARYAATRKQGDADFDEEEVRQAALRLAGSLPGTGVPLGNPSQVTAAMANPTVTGEMDRLTKLFKERALRKQEAAAAIKEKDLAKLRAALSADPRLAHIPIDDAKHMALGLAAIVGHSEAVDELLDNRGVNVDQKNPIGRTALHEVLSQQTSKTDLAAQQQVTAKAQKLISRGANVNARNRRGETALHLAGFRNNVPMITALSALTGAAAVDPTIRDDRGWSALDTTLAATNREAEDALYQNQLGSKTPPLKAGPLSTVDILSQATFCEDKADSHKARKFLEQLYANPELRPMLDLAAAAACQDRNPPNGGLRLFASKSNTVGQLYGQTIGATAAYDEKVNSLLFPLADSPGDGKEGDAVGSLAHELTHLTAHLVTNNPATLPFSDANEKKAYLAAIDADIRKVHLLDDKDPVQKFINDRFSGRMDSYKDKPGTKTPKTGAEFDESLLQEFIVGVPQVAAVYGMDELEKHLPGLVGYYKNVWTPKVKNTLATDPRFASGRAKIDPAANLKAASALEAHPKRRRRIVKPIIIKKDDARLNIDTLMNALEADFLAAKGRPKTAASGARTVNYQPDDYELSQADQKDFEKKKPVIRAALTATLSAGNFPPDIDALEVRGLVQSLTGAATQHSGSDLKTALNNRAANWVKGAKVAHVSRRIDDQRTISPQDLAEAVVYRAQARALAGGVTADLDPDMEVKASKQAELITALVKTLQDPANAEKLKDPARLIDELSTTLSAPDKKLVYQKANAAAGHVSVDVKKSKTAWMEKLKKI